MNTDVDRATSEFESVRFKLVAYELGCSKDHAEREHNVWDVAQGNYVTFFHLGSMRIGDRFTDGLSDTWERIA